MTYYVVELNTVIFAGSLNRCRKEVKRLVSAGRRAYVGCGVIRSVGDDWQ